MSNERHVVSTDTQSVSISLKREELFRRLAGINDELTLFEEVADFINNSGIRTYLINTNDTTYFTSLLEYLFDRDIVLFGEMIIIRFEKSSQDSPKLEKEGESRLVAYGASRLGGHGSTFRYMPIGGSKVVRELMGNSSLFSKPENVIKGILSSLGQGDNIKLTRKKILEK